LANLRFDFIVLSERALLDLRQGNLRRLKALSLVPKAGPFWSRLASFSGLLRSSRQNRQLRKQLIFYDFSVRAEGETSVNAGRNPHFFCWHKRTWHEICGSFSRTAMSNR